MIVSMKVSSVCRAPPPTSRLPSTLLIPLNLRATKIRLTLGCYILSFPITRVACLRGGCTVPSNYSNIIKHLWLSKSILPPFIWKGRPAVVPMDHDHRPTHQLEWILKGLSDKLWPDRIWRLCGILREIATNRQPKGVLEGVRCWYWCPKLQLVGWYFDYNE